MVAEPLCTTHVTSLQKTIMFDEIDQQESKWRRILSRPIHPDDAPPVDEDDEDEEDDDH